MKLMLLHSSGNKVLYDLDKEQIHTKYGILLKSEVNKHYGSILKAPNGGEFVVLEPSILDLVEGMKMSSKPIFPYDSGIMASLLNIKPGKRVLESGTGSGGFTTYLAELGAVVVTYEKNPDFFKTAQLNLHQDRKSTRLNSSHSSISYAVFSFHNKRTRHSSQSEVKDCQLKRSKYSPFVLQ